MTHIHARMRMLVALAMIGGFVPRGFAATPEPSPTPPPAGIRTDFGDVLIENLGIGQTYNLRDLAGTPLKVTNAGIETINLVMDVLIPTPDTIKSYKKEQGFKPIPDISWVTLTQTQFIVPSGQSAYTDVLINIPNDPSLYGKKFQANIYSRTTGLGMVNLAVWSYIQITIVKSPEDQAMIEKNRKHGIVESMDYTLLPDKLIIPNVPLGKTFDIKKETRKTITIANSGEKAIELRAKVIPVSDTPLNLQPGYETPDLSWLSVKDKTFTVEGSSFYDPGLSLKIPNDPALKGKKYMFILKVEPANPDVVGVTYFGKIFVEVQ
jgi:hypothetical protein